ncbi:MAG: IS1 family transposase [Anaerolineae bacterium]|nr:IS1 family transposase [Anaerolineae bacterium]
MDPHAQFCPNLACRARGKVGADNIRIHCRADQRYYCTVCHQRFTATAGTPLHGLHTSTEVVVQVVTLLAYGCPLQAIVAAFGLDARTVARWQQRAGDHCQQVHERLVLGTPQDLGQVQADELRVRRQRGIVWLASAIAVPTRLWLGGAVRQRRDTDLVTALAQQIRACALCRPLLVVFDGFVAYVAAFQASFRSPLPTGQRGRPPWVAWPDMALGQVVKHTVQRRVTGVERRVVQGTPDLVERLLAATQGGGVLNTAYIERLNGTFRASFAPLVRRSRATARLTETLTAGMYLVGCVYNFCRSHDSLAVELVLPHGRRWLQRTPAIAAGLTDHGWSVRELLSFKLAPPPSQPPKRRGRPAKASAAARSLFAEPPR